MFKKLRGFFKKIFKRKKLRPKKNVEIYLPEYNEATGFIKASDFECYNYKDKKEKGGK